jgi:hypothetical protein
MQTTIFQTWDFGTIDQGYINYLYYRGVFQVSGLILGISHPGDYLLSVRGVDFVSEPGPDGLYRVKGTDHIPGAMHQFNRVCPLLKGIQNACPRLPFDDGGFPSPKQVHQPCRWRWIERFRDHSVITKMQEKIDNLHITPPN